MKVSIKRRLGALEAKIKPEKACNVWNGVKIVDLYFYLDLNQRAEFKAILKEDAEVINNCPELQSHMVELLEIAFERYKAGVGPLSCRMSVGNGYHSTRGNS